MAKCIGYCFSCPYQYPECGWEGGIDFRILEHNKKDQTARRES